MKNIIVNIIFLVPRILMLLIAFMIYIAASCYASLEVYEGIAVNVYIARYMSGRAWGKKA